MFFERCGEYVGFPIFGEGFGHELLLGLWGQAADGRVAVQVGGEGVALGTGGDGVSFLGRGPFR